MWFTHRSQTYCVFEYSVSDSSQLDGTERYLVCDQNMQYVHGKLRHTLIRKYKKLTQPKIFSEPVDYLETFPCETEVVLQAPIKEKETKMGYNEMQVVDKSNAEARCYLIHRIEEIWEKKDGELLTKFNFHGEPAPKTLEDLKDRLATGKYTVDESQFNKDGAYRGWNSILHAVTWRVTPFDKAGYEAASKILNDAYQTAYDSIKVLTPEEGLKAVREFEAMTF